MLFGGGLSSYDPYATPNSTGSVAKAAAEMKKSKYDPGHTGKCTASACKGVLMVGDTRALDNRMIPVITADAKKIGITFTVRQINGAYTTIQTTNKNIPISERPGWGKDYADPYTFFGELFDSRALIPSGNTNYSLVGMKPSMAKSLGGGFPIGAFWVREPYAGLLGAGTHGSTYGGNPLGCAVALRIPLNEMSFTWYCSAWRCKVFQTEPPM